MLTLYLFSGIGPFLNSIIEQFEKKLESPYTGNKLTVYSGHDLNILGLLRLFGHTYHPMFSSSIYFELRKLKEVAYINVYFKNGNLIIPIIIDGCDFNCNLKDFKNLMKEYIIDDETFNKECQIESDKSQSTNNCLVDGGKES